MCGVRNLRCIVISDDRAQRGNEHQRVLEIFCVLLLIYLSALDGINKELFASVSQDPRRMQEVVDMIGRIALRSKLP